MTSLADSGPPPPPPSGPASAPAPGGGGRARRRRALLAAGAVAVAVGVVLALTLSGSSSASPALLAFSQARSDGAQAIASTANASGTLLVGLGLQERSGGIVNLSEVANESGAGCAPGPVGATAPATSLGVPAYGGSFASGLAPVWVLLFRAGTPASFYLVAATPTSTTVLAALTGTGCATALAALGAVPTALVDSPTAASAAAAGPDAPYPGTNALLMIALGAGVFDGVSTPSGWVFDYAPCSFFGGNATATATGFVVLLDAAGAIDLSLTESMDCPA